MDLAREAAATATSAVDKAVDEMAEAQTHTSAAERELAACRLAIAEMHQALQRVEQEHKKERREMALQRVRAAAELAASANVDRTRTKNAAGSPLAEAATPAPTRASGGQLVHAAADIGASASRALMNIDQSTGTLCQSGLHTANDQLELTRREDGSIDLRSVGVQQAFIKSFNSDLAQPRADSVGGDRAASDATSADTSLGGQLCCAEISEVDFTVTDAGELQRVSFDLRYHRPTANAAVDGAVGSTSATVAATKVRDVE